MLLRKYVKGILFLFWTPYQNHLKKWFRILYCCWSVMDLRTHISRNWGHLWPFSCMTTAKEMMFDAERNGNSFMKNGRNGWIYSHHSKPTPSINTRFVYFQPQWKQFKTGKYVHQTTAIIQSVKWLHHMTFPMKCFHYKRKTRIGMPKQERQNTLRIKCGNARIVHTLLKTSTPFYVTERLSTRESNTLVPYVGRPIQGHRIWNSIWWRTSTQMVSLTVNCAQNGSSQS